MPAHMPISRPKPGTATKSLSHTNTDHFGSINWNFSLTGLMTTDNLHVSNLCFPSRTKLDSWFRSYGEWADRWIQNIKA